MVLVVLVVLTVLVVLEELGELVVFLGGMFERVNLSTFLLENPKIKFLARKKNIKILKTKSEVHLDFMVLHGIIPL